MQVVRAAAVEAEPEFDYKTRQYDPKDLSLSEQDPEMLNLPKGYHWYETMLVLRATLGDEDRCGALADGWEGAGRGLDGAARAPGAVAAGSDGGLGQCRGRRQQWRPLEWPSRRAEAKLAGHCCYSARCS